LHNLTLQFLQKTKSDEPHPDENLHILIFSVIYKDKICLLN